MLDIDMTLYLLNLNAAFSSEFKMKEILPGGKWCMTSQIGVGSRTFMGPNSSISPPGKSSIVSLTIHVGITHINVCLRNKEKGGGGTPLHSYRNGAVDFEHTNLHGYNEVVILRRLPEEYRMDAMRLCSSMSLRSSPHDGEEQREWPTNTIIQKMKEKK